MFDDTPQVKWSNAWWGMICLGFLAPSFLLGLLMYCLVVGKAFAIGVLRYRALEIHEVIGLQANLMMIAYFCFAIASFAYGYARHHPVLTFYYDKVFALTLVVGAACIVWCSLLFLM